MKNNFQIIIYKSLINITMKNIKHKKPNAIPAIAKPNPPIWLFDFEILLKLTEPKIIAISEKNNENSIVKILGKNNKNGDRIPIIKEAIPIPSILLKPEYIFSCVP